MTFGCKDHNMVWIDPMTIGGDREFKIWACYSCGARIKIPIIIPLEVEFDFYDRRIRYMHNTDTCLTSRWNEESHKYVPIPNTNMKLLHEVLTDMIKDWNKNNPALPL